MLYVSTFLFLHTSILLLLVTVLFLIVSYNSRFTFFLVVIQEELVYPSFVLTTSGSFSYVDPHMLSSYKDANS